MLKVELIICLTDNTWRTDYVFFDSKELNTNSLKEIQELSESKYIAEYPDLKNNLVYISIYSIENVDKEGNPIETNI
jgi:hypothetical protein